MNFYQLGYFRTGKQGIDAGWKLVSASEGMDFEAVNGFKGIGANLVELKKVSVVPAHTLGIFQYERFLYIMHVNFVASGSDDRGVTYVHGYCFNLKEYYELCMNPDRIFGIQENNLIKEYDDSIEKYPILQELSYDAMDYDQLMKKYGFSAEEYCQMVLAAICAAEELTMPLCIKYTLPLEQYKQAYKEIMYLIMKGMPYHTRIKMTGYSFKGSNVAVYFSDTVEGRNYIDLDKKKFDCDYLKLESYKFTQIYKAFSNNLGDDIFRRIAQFIDAVFVNSIYDTGIDSVEAGFLRQNEAEITPERVIGLLQYFLECNLTENGEVYAYLKILLKVINKYKLVITDKEILKQLNIKYVSSDDNEIKREICDLYTKLILNRNEEEGFRFLLDLYHDFPAQHEMLCSELEMQDKEFYKKYHKEAYLPEYLLNLAAVHEYLEDSKNLDIGEYSVILSIVSGIIQKEFKKADDFQELYDIEETVERILYLLPKNSREMERCKNEFKIKMRVQLWESFEPSRFNPDDINKYKRCGVWEVCSIGNDSKTCENAQKIWQLVQLFEAGVTELGSQLLIETLRTGKVLSSVEDKERIRKLLSNEKLHQCVWKTQDDFNYSLALFYNCRREKIDILEWLKWIGEQGWDAVRMEKNIKSSKLLCYDGLSDNLRASIESEIKKKKTTREKNKEELAYLNYIYYCLTGQGKKDLGKSDRKYIYVLHRVPVHMFATSAIVFCLLCLHRYSDIPPVVLIAATAVVVLGGTVSVILKINQNDGVGNMMENDGINTIQRLLLYFGCAMVVAAVIVMVYVLPGILAKMTGVFMLSLFSVISVIVYEVVKKRLRSIALKKRGR